MEAEKTYEILENLFDLEMKSETSSHFIFYCPFCLPKVGKEDKEGKLYWSKDKSVGWCQRCHTACFPPTEIDETGKTDPYLNRLVNSTSERMTATSYSNPSPLGFDFAELNNKDLAYLKTRQPFLPLLAPMLGIKSWKGSTKGVAVPYIYKDYVASFQVRFYDIQPGQRKAYLPKDVPKILYSPQHVLNNFRLIDSETISLCEGWASAVALLCLGYPNPISVQGSHITDYQYFLLRKLMPDNAFIIMDDFEISKNIQNELKQKVPSISESKIISFGKNVDPEDHLKRQIVDKTEFNRCFSNVRELLTKFKNNEI